MLSTLSRCAPDRQDPVGLLGGALLGAAAGAAGTTALNATTYLDMVLRGRSASSTPEDTMRYLSDLAHVPSPVTGRRSRTGSPVSVASRAWWRAWQPAGSSGSSVLPAGGPARPSASSRRPWWRSWSATSR